jgi:hypothetical protein
MALGLTLGIVLALSGGNGTHIDQSSLGASPTSSPMSAAPAEQAVAPGTASPGGRCDLIVPADPLSPPGLATPYQLTGPSGASAAAAGCTLSAAAARAGLVRATILNPATGALAVYTPVVVSQGTRPAAAPPVPALPPGAIVTIDFGWPVMDLVPAGATAGALAQGHCVSGPQRTGPGSSAISSCNGAAFFTAALPLLRAGRLHLPPAGTSASMVATGGRAGTGRDCPNVRNFEVAGQDQGVGALVDDFLDPAFGCQPFTAPDLAHGNAPATSLALDELLAASHEPTAAALVPENEMARDAGGRLDPARTNAYRAELGQPAISARNDRYDSPAAYCRNMVNIQTPFLAANTDVLAAAPAPAAGTNLLTYLASRLSTAFGRLGCRQFGLTDPVTLVRDGAGAAVSATFDTTPQQVTARGGG